MSIRYFMVSTKSEVANDSIVIRDTLTSDDWGLIIRGGCIIYIAGTMQCGWVRARLRINWLVDTIW